MVTRQEQIAVKSALARCAPDFKHVNHYWDKQRDTVVAKILPGEFYMTSDPILISTTLGSCISACIWDERTKVGGMNHFMLPATDKNAHEVDWGQRGLASDATRYGNFAMEHLINTLLKHGAQRRNLRAKVFGGGKVLKKMSDIGERNTAFVFNYLSIERIEVVKHDVGSIYPRKVIFDPITGRAFVKLLDNLHNDTIAQRERDYRTRIDHESVEGDVELF
ncbi:chemoreceptor glutamine deamidase CheD [Thalassotalea euphylliae]|uniref:Probable chemoreceptor glutamine deamidase CheD n=1 Tax=Thalassotalea euphylliae TaxID=1655234 RepID=A0A3E0TPX7_9GAMM|nr:chemoreceptor glutamine deamidase CheD [Thalassotalea euphylliae]REL26584.1 chemoreceptor glutamine deamidase CheD [Thalassotalea euphylliae]